MNHRPTLRNAHIITDEHLEEDGKDTAIGTTKRGNGPAYREKYARNGYPVHEVAAHSWDKSINKLLQNASSKNIFSKNRKPYKFGEIHKNIKLADTLKSIAKNNIKDFYQGYIAKDIVDTLAELGGLHTLEDFQYQNTVITESISNNFKKIKFINVLQTVQA